MLAVFRASGPQTFPNLLRTRRGTIDFGRQKHRDVDGSEESIDFSSRRQTLRRIDMTFGDRRRHQKDIKFGRLPQNVLQEFCIVNIW